MVAKTIRAPLWLLISALLARVLGPSGLGTWSMILAAATFLNQLLLHWTQSITQRFGRGEWLATKRLDRTWATRWPSLAIGLGIIVFLLLAKPFDWPTRFYGLDDERHWFVFPALLTVWLMAEAQSLQQVRERFGALAWSPVIADLALLAVLGLLLLARDMQGGSLELNLSLACIVAAGLGAWVLWLARELYQTGLTWRLPSRDTWRRAALFAAPLIPGFLIAYLSEWCDYFLIRHFYSEHEVGLFHPAYQYMLILVGLPTAVAVVLLPKVTATADTDDGTGVRTLVAHRAPQLATLWLLFSLAIVAALPALFSLLLGPRYDISVNLLRVLLVAVPGAIVSHIYGIACFVQGRLGVSTLGLFGVKSIVNISISFALLPQLGVIGSALGSAASFLVLQWLFLLDQHIHLRIRLGAGAIALLLAHTFGVMQAFVADTMLRLLLAFVTGLLVLLWARQTSLFARAELSAMIPRRLSWARGTLLKILCRPA